jgi:hypothetical protein
VAGSLSETKDPQNSRKKAQKAQKMVSEKITKIMNPDFKLEVSTTDFGGP